MPLTLAPVGKEMIVRRVGGCVEVRQHLSDIGFVAGAAITVVAEMGSNLIVRVKESRVALSREVAGRIIV